LKLLEQLPLFRLPPPDTASKQRHIHIGSRIVAYDLRQAANRRLAMTIDERGLHVGAPRSLSLRAVEDFIRSHADWVVKKLDEYASRPSPRHLTIRDGSRVPVLGGEVVVRVREGANRAHWGDDELVLAARPGADLDALARRALQRKVLEYFRRRVAHYAPRLGCPIPPVALSSARMRWGSCSSETGIRLNWRLVHLPPEFADYVVAHELAHLIEMNHSARFWKVVGRIFPDWRRVREELKRRAAEIPLL
jgi:predicted metal-dependent hydrolase